jgi:hypothetical protein
MTDSMRKKLRRSMAQEDIYKMARAPSRDPHVRVAELKETAQVPPTNIEYRGSII